MRDKDIIIRGVQDSLDGMLKKTKEAGPDQLESTKWWTRQVMTALCAWGIKNLNKRFWIGASGIGDAEGIKKLARDYGGKIQGEWLYDLTFLEYDDGYEYLKRIPLVAESEWKDPYEIEDDFQKLLAARADVRLMVFNGNWYRTDEPRSSEGKTSIESDGLKRLIKYITECEHTQAGDTYLFAARLHEDEGGRSANHRFDYHRFDAPSKT